LLPIFELDNSLMKRYVLKRIALFLFSLLAAASLVFFLIHLVPGDPLVSVLGEGAHPDDILRLQQELGLDKPLMERFWHFMGRLLSFDLGRSLFDGNLVWSSIMDHLPNTLLLAAMAMCLAWSMAFPLGVYAAFRENKTGDTLITFFSTLGLAVPNFVLGPLLIILFSVMWGVLPVSGSGGFKHLVLPALTLGSSMAALSTHIVKTAVARELAEPYVLFARARGLSEFRVFWHHILKNALLSIITLAGLQLGALTGGAIITEKVFALPGMGMLLIQAVTRRDYTTVQGVVLFITFAYLTIHFFVDILYYLLDPRIAHDA